MYKLKGSIWIEGKKGTFIGMGRVMLLERIKQHGSITLAARSMKMSYRHAWELVDAMNRESKVPLVETSAGGKGGGGTKVTTEGEKVIRVFRNLQNKFDSFCRTQASDIKL